jgi:hypothetical protein
MMIKDIMNKVQDLDSTRMLLTQLYVRVGVLLTCGKHLHDYIISRRGKIRTSSCTINQMVRDLTNRYQKVCRGRRSDCMIIGFMTTDAISTYHH